MLVTSEQNRRNQFFAGSMSVLASAFALVLGYALDAFHTGWLFPSLLGVACGGGLLFYFLRRRTRQRFVLANKPFSTRLDAALAERVEFYRGLSQPDRGRFQRLVRVFLDETPVIGVGTEINDEVRILVGASAIIPIFGFPDWEYGLAAVLVYSGDLPGDGSDDGDGKSKVVGRADFDSGSTADRVLLSKEHLLAGFQNPRDRKNVGIHEFAHVVDGADGAADGTPPSPADKAMDWKSLVQEALKDPERAHVLIDPYGFTNHQEFFACLTETFFETPMRLKEQNPKLFEHMTEFYGQDPSTTLKRARKGRKRLQKLGRNSRCPCGSGEKFKKCCLGKSVTVAGNILD